MTNHKEITRYFNGIFSFTYFGYSNRLQLIHVNFLPTAHRYIYKKRYSIRKIMTFIFQN